MASFVPPVVPRAQERSEAHRRWQRRASPLARYALLAYALVVVDASLFPFGGWRDIGIGPFDYLWGPWPRHVLPFDLTVNALGYLPLGFFAGMALHPRVRGVATVVVGTLSCAALSIGMEAVQTYLPARVASTVDVLSNVAGGLAGAALGARFAPALLDTGRLRMWRARWFGADVSRGLVLVCVWFGALIYPDVFVFGTGGLLKLFDPDAAQRLMEWAGFGTGNDPAVLALRFQWTEAAVTTLTLVGVGLLFLTLFRSVVRWTFRVGLLAGFLVLSVAVEAASHAFLFEDATAWPLLTQGARTGIALAALALLAISTLPATWRWVLACVALVGAVVLVNACPDNPYATAVGTSWTRGRLMNFYGLASGLNLVWPYFALAYLVRHRPRAAKRTRPRGSL